jgi:hypothetical protein
MFEISNLWAKLSGIRHSKTTKNGTIQLNGLASMVHTQNIQWLPLPPPQAFQKNKIGGKRTERPAD